MSIIDVSVQNRGRHRGLFDGINPKMLKSAENSENSGFYGLPNNPIFLTTGRFLTLGPVTS